MRPRDPYWVSGEGDVTLYLGDCLDVLRGLPADSVDAIVTDPPAAVGFMGREWDSNRGGRTAWVAWLSERLSAAVRVLKPGGHVLVWSLPRTSHWTAWAVEDAGLEIRDCVVHMFGSGFPKSLDIGKAIDKRRDDTADIDQVRIWLDAERRKAGLTLGQINDHFGHASNGGGSASSWTTNPTSRALPTWEQWGRLRNLIGFGDEMDAEVWRLNGRKGTPGEAWDQREITQPGIGQHTPGDVISWDQRSSKDRERRDIAATPEAARWDGFGTSLKPGQELWWLARKPLSEGSVAGNVLRWGTGGLNVDGVPGGTGRSSSGPVRAGPRRARSHGDGCTAEPDGAREDTALRGGGRRTSCLSHSAGCVPAGTRQVRGSRPRRSATRGPT